MDSLNTGDVARRIEYSGLGVKVNQSAYILSESHSESA